MVPTAGPWEVGVGFRSAQRPVQPDGGREGDPSKTPAARPRHLLLAWRILRS